MANSINNLQSNAATLHKTQLNKQKNDEALASGKRINKAADDAAGLLIANRLTGQINGLNQQSQGAQDQINLNNIQSARLSALTENLGRAQTLAVQSNNPLYQADPAIQDELTALTEEINLVAEQAFGQSNFVTGLDASNPSLTQTNIEQALATVNQQASSIGAQNNTLDTQVSIYQTSQVNLSQSRSQIQDADIAKVTAEKAQNDTLEQVAIKLQKNANERKGLLINKLI